MLVPKCFGQKKNYFINYSILQDGKPIAEINVEGDNGAVTKQPAIQLGTPHMATIMILDDDHGGRNYSFFVVFTTVSREPVVCLRMRVKWKVKASFVSVCSATFFYVTDHKKNIKKCNCIVL